MRIDDLSNQQEEKVHFDVIDDAIVFMRNDPQFYRKKYFPAVSKIADMHRANKTIDNKSVLGSMVDSGMSSYCKKYGIAKRPSDIFTMEDRDAIIEQIFSEELEEIKKGSY